MIKYTSSDPKDAIKTFLDEFMSDLQSGKLMLASRHIDEIVPQLPKGKKQQIELAVELFSELIKQYKGCSEEFMAILNLSTDYEDTLQVHTLQELVEGDLELYPPPELYLIPRMERKDEPFIKEEYIVPIQQSLITPQDGVVYAYYKTTRAYQQREAFSPGFYFEHYQDDAFVEHDWK